MEPIGTLAAGIAVLNVGGLFAFALAERRARQIPRPPCPPVAAARRRRQRAAEALRFFGAWLRAPLRVAAVAPSGPALARLMTSEISPGSGPVIELGPGTGAFTRALLARGVRQEDLALVESGPSFADDLRRAFPGSRTLCMDAAALHDVELFEGRRAGAVVSGLPLLSMPPAQVEAILKGAFDKLAPDGAFYQFTYGPHCPVPGPVLKRLALEAERIGGTLANLPPAAVYRLRRTGHTSSCARHS